MRKLQIGEKINKYHLKQMKGNLYGDYMAVQEFEVGHHVTEDDDWVYWRKEAKDLDQEILGLEERRAAIKEVEDRVIGHNGGDLEERVAKLEYVSKALCKKFGMSYD